MTRKTTRRRHRPADPMSWAYAIAGQWDMDPALATKIVLNVRTAYQRMREGNGTDADFDTVGAALNVAVIRAEKIGKPLEEAISAGMGALLEADRGQGRYTFTGPGILSMNAAVELYEEILRNSTPRQMQEATQEGFRRIRAGLVREAKA